MNFIKLLRSQKTVFTTEDLKLILDTNNENTIRNFFYRAQKKWLLENIYYWIRKLVDKDINIFEFASKVKKNSYISFETVLKKEWIIFQYYGNTIFLASDNTWEKKTKDFIIKYNKLKSDILINPLGINHKKWYAIASPERAICDRIYISPGYFFDNLENIDLEKLAQISQIYNKRVILEVKKLIQDARHQNS